MSISRLVLHSSLFILGALGQLRSYSQSTSAMVVAISRDKYVLGGGLGPSEATVPGKLSLEILAYVTPEGIWKDHPCAQSYSRQCRAFAKSYLGLPHHYIVASADGYGAEVNSSRTTLSECFSYTTTATYSGASIRGNAIATDTPELFDIGPQPSLLTTSVKLAIRHQLVSLFSTNLEALNHLKIERIQLEGQSFVTISGTTDDSSPLRVFLIADWEHGRLRVLHRKKNEEDEEELALGTIHLKSGRDFLITTVHDPESQTFRIYGIRGGKLTLVYAGGGSSC